MEDDVYGGGLYDDANLDFEADDPYEDQEMYMPSTSQPAKTAPTANGTKVGEDQKDLQNRISEQEERLHDLQSQLGSSQNSSNKLRTALKEIGSCCGFSFANREPDAQAIVESVQATKKSEKTLQDEVKLLRRKEAALHIQLAEKNMENIELRRELNHAWQSSDPSIIQLKQLLLDPAINREFLRLKTDLDKAQKELKHAQEDLQAVNFTQESKTGRALMAKCRSLQEENEEMGRELSEGKIHQLEVQLSMAKQYAEELKKNYSELEDHCSVLDEEAEHMQQQLMVLRRQNSSLEMQLKQKSFDRKPDEMGGPPFARKPMGRGGGMKRPFADNDIGPGPLRHMPMKQRRK